MTRQMNQDLETFFIEKKRVDFLTCLYNHQDEELYSRKVSRKIGVSTTTISDYMYWFKEYGLIDTENGNGNKSLIKLTDKGRELGQALDMLQKKLVNDV